MNVFFLMIQLFFEETFLIFQVGGQGQVQRGTNCIVFFQFIGGSIGKWKESQNGTRTSATGR